MITSTHLCEGWRFLKHHIKVKSAGYRKYKGNARHICRDIVKDCWNSQYFQTSAGHYSQFWTRDFSWCVDSLMKLGYEEEVKMTLVYALSVFGDSRKITTTITPEGKAFNFPDRYAPDSLASFIYSLHASGFKQLIREYKDFLDGEIQKFFNVVLDKDTGLVKRRVHFSSMKDHYIRDSSCYDNIMAAWLDQTLRKIKSLYNPFKGFNFRGIIKDNFWTGNYFLDDLSGSMHISGDANIFPFWTKVFDSRKMFEQVVFEMQSAGLDQPFPLKYTAGKEKKKTIWVEKLVPDWEKDSIWAHMGMLYLKLVKQVDEELFEDYYRLYENMIKKHKTFLELYDRKGNPYSSPFYSADEGMLWCANFLALKK